jgi:hypothetical protein
MISLIRQLMKATSVSGSISAVMSATLDVSFGMDTTLTSFVPVFLALSNSRKSTG